MPEISLSQIHQYYGSVHVLKGLSLDVPYGAKLGIVGGNGSGKTTLFRVISGELPYEKDKGSLHIARGRRIGVLGQLPVYDDDLAVKDVLMAAFAELTDLKARLDALVQDMTNSQELLSHYGALQSEYEHRGGYEIEIRFNRVTQGLNIPQSMLDQPFEKLSGGEKTRVSLAQIILRNTDILLLDEPTNHLDIQSVEWLEEFLSEYRGTVLMISHDRYFLDQVADNIFEIEDGKGFLYPGNYSAYAELKERQRIEALARFEQEQKKIKQLEAAAKRLHDWANRADNPKFHRQAFNIEKRVERLQRDGTAKPRTEKTMRARFHEDTFKSNEALSVNSVSKRFAEKTVLEKASLILYGGDRLALLGPNGSGKTTLLRIILEQLDADEGTIKIGPSVRVGYLPQEVCFEEPSRSVLDTVRYAKAADEAKTRNLLATYKFIGDDVFKCVSSLSGGEKSRLKLCLLMQEDVNLLILDEPTNHLDLHSREWIEEALGDFSGTILFVSHDRYFIRRFATRIAELNSGKVETWQLDYSEWRAWKERKNSQGDNAYASSALEDSVSDSEQRRQAGKNRQRDISKAARYCEDVEKSILSTEKRLAEIEIEMATNSSDFVLLHELVKEKERMVAELPLLYDEWGKSQERFANLTSQ